MQCTGCTIRIYATAKDLFIAANSVLYPILIIFDLTPGLRRSSWKDSGTLAWQVHPSNWSGLNCPAAPSLLKWNHSNPIQFPFFLMYPRALSWAFSFSLSTSYLLAISPVNLIYTRNNMRMTPSSASPPNPLPLFLSAPLNSNIDFHQTSCNSTGMKLLLKILLIGTKSTLATNTKSYSLLPSS